ncbi:hypothetical protein ETD86_01340 [Nonomuraea turkmeniaca]|uniref:NB-ARC domain-containing protein n=1 Tax=Nonomuraea turkmeniaca TaxID=103838 RepID=A0A5S4FX49_9ACTN|nr:NB-ARC domain-containing protein [Nonomuraea turkmeniaca]TMR25268.1 hypothetical protein ETD86_01340 [Nonomuraea turkmeniaca]
MLEDLVAALVSGKHLIVTLVPEVAGAEGFGTTTLAAAACRRPEVREHFRDGIEWVSLGDDPVHLLRHRVTTRLRLDPEIRARDILALAVPRWMRPVRRLVVLDDVRPEAAELIMRVAADKAVVLVTGGQAPPAGHVFELPANAGGSQGWPLLRTLMRSLDAAPDEPVDLTDPRGRARAVNQVLGSGLAGTLAPRTRERLLELGAFKGTRPIPLELTARLWWETAGLTRAESESLLAELATLGLLSRAPDRDAILMPGVVRDHIRAAMGPARAKRADLAIVEIGPPEGDGWSDEALVYFFEWFADHLEAAGGDLEELVCRGSWLATRLLQAGPEPVLRELARAGTDEAELLRRTLSQSLHLLGRPPYTDVTVIATLACRLHHLQKTADQLRGLLDDLGRPWLECLWTPPDLPHPTLRATLAAHEGEATSVAISPDGAWLATAGQDGPVRLWNRDGTVRGVLEGHLGQVNRVAIAPDGTWLATGGSDGTVCLWSAGGERLRELAAGFGAGHDVAIAPDGAWLATLDLFGGVTAWSRRGRRLWRVEGDSGDVSLSTLAIAADGSWLAHVVDGHIQVWNADGTARARFPHEKLMTMVAAHPTRDALMTNDGTLYSPDGRLLEKVPIEDSLYARLTVATDGGWLATGVHDDVLVARLDRPAIERLAGHEDSVADVAISPDGTWLASVSADGTARIWTHEELPRLDDRSPRGVQTSPAVAPGGSVVTAGAELTYWDDAGNPLRTVPGMSGVTSVAACDSWLAAWDDHDRLWLIDGDGTVRRRLRTHHSRPYALAVAPDGSWFATCGEEGTIGLWSGDGGEIGRLRPEAGPVRFLAVSGDSRTLVAASTTAVQRWTRQGRQTGRVRRLGATVRGVAASPDGSRTAVVLASGAIRQWDGRGRRVATLMGSANYTAGLAYSPSGTLLAAAYDSTLQVWDVPARRPMAGLRLGALLRGCAWSPDGTRLYAAGDAGLYGFTLHVPIGPAPA